MIFPLRVRGSVRPGHVQPSIALAAAVVATQVCTLMAVACSRSVLPGAAPASYAWAAGAVLAVLVLCVVALEVSMVTSTALALLGGVLLVNAVTAATVAAAGSTPVHVLYLSAFGQVRDGVVVGWAPQDRNLVTGNRSVVVAGLDGLPLSRSSQIDAALLSSDVHPDLQSTVSREDLVAGRMAVGGAAPSRTTAFWVDRWGAAALLPAPAVSGVDLRSNDVAAPLTVFLVAYGLLTTMTGAAVRAART